MDETSLRTMYDDSGTQENNTRDGATLYIEEKKETEIMQTSWNIKEKICNKKK